METFLVKRKTDNVKELQRQFCDTIGETGKTESDSITRACFNVAEEDVPPPGMHSMGQDFRIDMKEESSVEIPEDLGWDEPAQ